MTMLRRIPLPAVSLLMVLLFSDTGFAEIPGGVKKAPDFTLSSIAGHEVSLHDFAGRKVLLVFVQPGCGPCHAVVPDLNRLASRKRDVQVLVAGHDCAGAASEPSSEGQPWKTASPRASMPPSAPARQ